MKWRQPFSRPTAWAKSCAHASVNAAKAFSPYAWLPILTVGLVSAFLAYKNLSLQQAGNRPDLSFPRIDIRDPYDGAKLEIWIKNIGTRSAYAPVIVAKSFDLDASEINTLLTVTGGNYIARDATPTAIGAINITKLLGVMALCVRFFDEAHNEFNNVFFYRFPTLNLQFTSGQRSGGPLEPTDLSPDDQVKAEHRNVCQ
jgi:hypothetical protein